MLITLITATGGRKESFALSEKWFLQQTILKNLKYKVQWVVIDDCPDIPTRCTCRQEYYIADKKWTPSINTHRYNLDQAFSKIKGDVIINWEDDDYFAPNYLEEMLKLLETNDIAGLSNNQYYHLKLHGFKYMNNYKHSSLVTTVFTKKVLPLFYKAIHNGEFFFDISLWRYAQEEKLKSCLISNSNLSIGIKGGPGKKGLTSSHNTVGYHADDNLEMFKTWLGKDWELYKPYLKS